MVENHSLSSVPCWAYLVNFKAKVTIFYQNKDWRVLWRQFYPMKKRSQAR